MVNRFSRGATPGYSYFAPGYAEYIKSIEWKTYREQYFARHYKMCRVCRSIVQIQLHHLDHRNYKSKFDGDYVPLCQNHHRDITRGFQKRRDRRQTMRLYTLEYIAIHKR